MGIGWLRDKEETDPYMPAVKRICGQYLLQDSDAENDQKRATDIMTPAMRIAVRIRGQDYIAGFGDQFTVRASRPSGNMSEMSKIMSGWGDAMLYGFKGQNLELSQWTLIDLYAFRLEVALHMRWHNGEIPSVEDRIPNADKSSEFLAFKFSSFTDSLVIASSWKKKEAKDPFVF